MITTPLRFARPGRLNERSSEDWSSDLTSAGFRPLLDWSATQPGAGVQVSLTTPGAAYTQNFDALASTGSTGTSLPVDWTFSETGGSAPTTYSVGTGSSNTGDTWSFGVAGTNPVTDRAFGGVGSGTVTQVLIGTNFVNNTGATITQLGISYFGEQWRNGGNTTQQKIDFQISFNATSLTTGTWTDVNALDFLGPIATATAGALDGNAAANRVSIASTITSLTIANGATFWIRWVDVNDTGNDHGLAIDDFSLTPTTAAGSPGELSINDVMLAEGDSDTTAFTFTVTRANGSSGAVGATWTLTAPGGAGNADAGDFGGAQLFTGTVAFADGDTSETITILVQGDDLVEPNEAFTVALSVPTGGATITDATGAGSITNDDASGAFSIDDVTITEGNGGTTPMIFTVTRASGDDGAVTVGYSVVAPGGAGFADSADFAGGTIFSGTVAFADGETSKTISLDVVGDTVFESNETFEVQLTSASSGTIDDGLGIGTINNDDPAPAGTLSIDDVSLGEGDNGTTTTFTFTVTRSAGTAGAIMADYAISAPGGAGNASNDDLVAGAIFSGQVAFADGETSQTISIDVEGDVDFESDESFTVTLSNATGGAGIGDGTGIGTIVNDDLQPPAGQVGIADASIVEGDSGTSTLVLTLTRTGGTGAFAVNYATSNGGTPGFASATAPSDYIAASGTVSFADGQNTATIQITINGDTLPELNEEFTVTLSAPTNGATLSDSTAIATITSDDPQPASTRIFEEHFTTFTAGGFAPNPTASQIDSDIWRVVGLSDIPTPAYGFTATTGDFARGTIGSNDPTTAGVYSPTSNPALILQPTGAEIEAGGFIEARIQNSSGSTATGFDIAFDWAYRNSGDRASSLQFSYSTDGTNFITVPAAAFSTPAVAGAATNIFALQNELISLTGLSVADQGFIYLRWTHLSSAGSGNRDEFGIDNITVDATGGATGPLVSVSDVSVNEAAGTMTFTVSRANAASGAFTVDYETANGTATAGSDYVAASGTLSFSDNQLSQTVTVTINNESTPELDETLFLNLSDASGATIADGQGVGTIVNDDGAPIQVSINDVSIVEGDSSTSVLTFTVTRTGGTGAFDVNFNTQDGSAVEPGDYLANSGTLSFGVGQNSQTISITINGDTTPESNEAFQVLLSGATNDAIIIDGSGTGTIVNDEPTFIHDIQGTSYFSPILAGDGISGFNTASTTVVTVRAIVTAVDNVGPRQGYYLAEEITDWDGNSFTSEGIFVMTRNDAGVGNVVSGVSVGDLVQLSANVMEYQAFSTMPRTMLVNSTGLQIISTGNALPTVTLTSMPNAVMTLVTPDYIDSSDGAGDTFDASVYALSYYETVEGMLVTIPNMVVADGFVSTSGGDPFLQAYSLDSANPGQINSRGGYTIAGDPPIGPPDTATPLDDTHNDGRVLHDGDVNPDIIELDFTDFAGPAPSGLLENATMGDLLGDVTGIIDFDFTDRKLFVTAMEPGGFVNGGIPVQETTALGADPRSLTVATFNVENLDALDSAAKFAGLADAIANNLKSPDIICIEEIQDNNGPGAGSRDASLTWQILVDAVNAATGKNYQWVDEEPNGSEGGEPGGNIRVGFLYNTDRVQLGDLDANATLAERRQYTDRIGDGTRDAGDLIAFSDDMLGAEINTVDWTTTRKSLLGEFTFNGNSVYVTANHWPAKGGSGDFWQLNQNLAAGEPDNSDWAQRNQVAQDVYAMLNLIEGSAPGVGIVAGGDFNDFYFYRPLTTVTGYTLADGTARSGGARFDNLTLTLPEAERYTYTFDGRSQAIDHIIVNDILSDVATYDVVHLNTGYNSNGTGPNANPALSDHDPGVSSFDYRNFSEVLNGTAGADSIDGFDGDDVITGGGGNDDIDGGTGEDTAVYAGNRADYTVTGVFDSNGNLIGFQSVTDNVPGNGDEGTDTLESIEILQFADMTLTLTNVGFAVELYDASDVLVASYATIQEAVNAASDGYRIFIGAGTYTENVTVDVDVTIQGANVGVAGSGTRVAESIIDGQVTISADGVTIDGVSIVGDAAGPLGTTGVIVGNGSDTFSIVNSVLDGDGDFAFFVNVVSGLNIATNLIQGYSIGAYITGGNTAGSVHDNLFQGDVGPLTGLGNGVNSESSHVLIQNNIFDGLYSGVLNLFPFGPNPVDLDSYVIANTLTDNAAPRPVQIYPTAASTNIIGTDYNEAFNGDIAGLVSGTVLTFDGQGGDDHIYGFDAGDTLSGGSGSDRLFGQGGGDILNGGADSDHLFGEGGDDILNGGTGNDAIDGAGGIDTATFSSPVNYADTVVGWIVSSADGNDILNQVEIVVEGSGQRNLLVGSTAFATIQAASDAAEADDIIRLAAGNYSGSVSYDEDGLTVIAQTGARQNVSYTTTSGFGISVFGANLADTITGGDGNDALNGGGAADTLNGGAGADYLDGGGGGVDHLIGGSGNDALVVDADDTVAEAIGGGFDNVAAKVSYILAEGAEIEVLSTTDNAGTAAINLNGNSFGQVLVGNVGNNYLDGGGGADLLVGLGGDDALIVDADDQVIEAVGGGFDNVAAKVSYVLGFGAEIEVLSTTDNGGSAAINLTGNEFGQVVVGNAGANVLDGKAGNDVLVGLGGADSFAFTTSLDASGVDAILGFLAADDTILLEDSVFTGLAAGALPAGAFATGAAATEADDRIIYNQATGQLFFDVDGNGAQAQVLFATLQGAPLISASDFTVI